MEEQFVLRVPPSVAERLDRVLSENPASPTDQSIDLAFEDDGRTGTFMIGNDKFAVSLLDLPCVVESYKTYDDTVLIKTADIGQIIIVREEGETPPEGLEYKHGLTPPMRDARRRRFRREPDLNPDFVHQVENDLQSIMAGGTARDVDVEVVEQEEDVDEEMEVTEQVQDGSQPSSTPMELVSKPASQDESSGEEDDYDND
ncbi:hypothetical protein O6H91_17G032300 [Diphasiastrum complanatum]|uniref:Uncharacterized protein n=1 Tax=Diphasiastrum complanatum TaxID=34168 RepID=A0ACC2B5E1_DIPCM|nr:hypothetical protein O6H91_17G032300 [Diphasiastrum complanatum]